MFLYIQDGNLMQPFQWFYILLT